MRWESQNPDTIRSQCLLSNKVHSGTGISSNGTEPGSGSRGGLGCSAAHWPFPQLWTHWSIPALIFSSASSPSSHNDKEEASFRRTHLCQPGSLSQVHLQPQQPFIKPRNLGAILPLLKSHQCLPITHRQHPVAKGGVCGTTTPHYTPATCNHALPAQALLANIPKLSHL